MTDPDTLRDELARTITAHLRPARANMTCVCGKEWTPVHVADALLPVIDAHVQAERERIEKETTDRVSAWVREIERERIAQAIEADYGNTVWIAGAARIARRGGSNE